MAIELVRSYLKQFGRDGDIIELSASSATVALAAETLGVIPARIAKTLSFRASDGGVWLIVAAGDAKIDNPKYKAQFGTKASMLSPDEALTEIGHAVGGICPFGIENPKVSVYLDVSLKRFETVYPACGSSNSAIELNLEDLYTYSKAAAWIDVCKGWEAE